jgi:hypothetical protein
MLAPTAAGRSWRHGLAVLFLLLQQPDKMMGALLDMLVAKGARTIVMYGTTVRAGTPGAEPGMKKIRCKCSTARPSARRERPRTDSARFKA